MIDSAFEKVAENKTEDLNVHFVCAGFYNWLYSDEPEFRSLLPERMEKYKLKHVMVTSITMKRRHLITKAQRDAYCDREKPRSFMTLEGKYIWSSESFNGDLESLLEDIHFGKQPDHSAETLFIPRLSEEERKDDD